MWFLTFGYMATSECLRMIILWLFVCSVLSGKAQAEANILELNVDSDVIPLQFGENSAVYSQLLRDHPENTPFISFKDKADSEDFHGHRVRSRRDLVFVGGGAGNDESPSKVQITTLKAFQSCSGVVIQWESPSSYPFSQTFDYESSEFRHYNVYRSDADFSDVTDMKPYSTGKVDPALKYVYQNTWIDTNPVVGKEMYYAVAVQDRVISPKVITSKVLFIPAFEGDGQSVFALRGVLRGKTLHHSLAYHPTRNEYLLAFDWDINNDGIPEHLYAIRQDVAGNVVDKNILNFTASITGWTGGSQGWPSVAYNPRTDEYLAVFHMKSKAHFSGQSVILGQRLRSDKTVRAASPSLVIKGEDAETKQPAPISNPDLIYNPMSGGFAMTVIFQSNTVILDFLNARGQHSNAGSVFKFTKNIIYNTQIFLDSKLKEIFVTCQTTTKNLKADFEVQNVPYIVLMTKRNSTGGQATPVGKTTNHFIGYTTKKPANIRGYYNDDVERLFLFWDTTDKSGKSVIESSTILANSLKFNRRTNLNSCTSKTDISSATPSFIPGTGHMLVWQEKVNGKWRLGGSLLKRNAFTATDREQKSPVTFYNPVKRNIFVMWREEENGQSYIGTQHIKPSSSYSCSPACKKGLFCRWLDTCRPNQNGKSCLFNNGGCSDVCLQDGNDVLCSCPIGLSLEQDRRTCKKLAPCNGQNPIKDLTGNNINCGRDRGRGRGGGGSNCPKDSYCHVHPADQFAVCCPVVKPDLTMLIASEDSIWQITVISPQNKIAFTKLPFTTTKIVAVDYDPVEQYVYWTDVATGRIHKARYGKIDAVVETVVGGFLVPDGLVLDTSERKIYWTDGGKDQIGVVNMDGSGLKELINQQLDQPRALALHKTKRLMYWSDWGATPKIERSNLEGANRRVIVNSLLGWPNGLVVDEKYQKLYFADALLDKIESCDLDGNGRQLITAQSPHPFSLAILNDKLYWSDWNYGGILSVDKSSKVDTLVQGLLQPKDICIIEAIPLQQDFDCMDTGVPLNGGRNPKPSSSGTYKTNTKVHFTCNPGYVHIGPSSLVCRPSGQWSDTTPRCKALPVISVGLFNQTVESGKSVVLKCILSGGKRRWLKDGTEMSNFQVGHHFISPINGYLVLERVHQVDSGIYTCQGYNDAGTVQSDAYLYVQGSTYKDCGQPKFSTRGRIIGGRIAGHGAHPWQVLVILGNKSNRKGFCGGTLISPKWVVTAAHCLRGLSPNRVQVKLGKHRRTKVEATEQVSEVDKIELNNFNDQTYDSDVALLHLAGNITFTDYIKPVCLPLKESDMSLLAPNVTALISGWGSKKAYDLKGSYRLREVAVPIVTQQQCKDAHPTYIVTQNMFCAGHSEGSKGDACQGDSGGPLVIKNTKTNRWVLFGVISWGDRCGIDGKYGVYTRLPNFIDWILSITQI